MPRTFAFLRPLSVLISVGAFTGSLDAAELRSASGRILVENEQISIFRRGERIVQLDAIQFDYHRNTGWEVSSATDERIAVTLTYPPSVNYYHRAGQAEAHETELVITRQGDGFRFHAAPDWSDQVTLEFEYLGDHFFGLSSPLQPRNQLSPDLTGSVIDVEVTNEGERIVENYASAFSAFYLSTHGYGSFFDTFARGRYELGINGRNRIHHDTGTLDWYVLLGDDGSAIHRAYFDIIGSPKKVPLWALGPVAWRDQNDGGAAEILDDISRFADLRMPLTAWFVDRPYSDGAHAWSRMNFSEKFAEPEKWIPRIREEHGLEFMTWTATAMFGDTSYPRHLPGGFSYLDLSHPETVASFQQNLADLQYVHGVKGHKMDRADEHFPPWEGWHDNTVRPSERRNRYAYLFAKVHHDALRRAWGDDQFNFSRAAIHRSQPYTSAIWGGDPRTSWAGLQGNAANAMRAAFMGFPVWGTDVGGYIGEGLIAEDLYLRWLQFGVMCGMLEIKLDGSGGDGRDRMPWRYDEKFQDQYRAQLQTRMAWLPHLYSLTNNAAEQGTVMQPLAYRHFDDIRTYDIWDQFYLGDGVMVAPIFTPGTVRDVYLPAGTWYRFGEKIEATLAGSHAVVTQAALDEIPVFVRANSLLITGNIFEGNARTWTGGTSPELIINAFPGRIGEATTYTYIDALDGDAKKSISLTRNATGIIVTAPPLGAATTVIIHQPAGSRQQAFGPTDMVSYTWDD